MIMENNSHAKIVLTDMEIDVRIGLHAHEQEGGRSQRILVSVELFVSAVDYLTDTTKDTIIDYDYIYGGIKAWANRPHTLLIETYVHELLGLCFKDERIAAARVSVTKPDIFPDVARAGVEAFMCRADWAPA